MTAETLKPFILPTSNSFNIQKHSPKNSGRHLWILIGLSVALLTLSAAAVYITVWEAVRMDKLEKQVESLSNELADMKSKFGFDDLDDLNDFEREYSKSDDNSNDIDDDDDEDSYEQSGNFLPNRFDDLEDGEDDDEYNDDENYDEFSSEDTKKSEEFIDDEKKIRIIRAIDVSVYPESNGENKPVEKKPTVKHLKHKRRMKANYNRQAHPYYHKRSPQVKSMMMQRQGRVFPNSNALAAAHYHMNSTVPGNHPHHLKHMKIPHDGDIYIGAAHNWPRTYDLNSHFSIEHGLLKVHEGGVFFVYAQVLYQNNFDKNGYRIYHNEEPFLQCALTIPNNMAKSNTCYTSGIIYLRRGDMLHMRDLFKDRTVALRGAKSFFGIVKLTSD
ncbi:EDA family protein [Megaselia abdita]